MWLDNISGINNAKQPYYYYIITKGVPVTDVD
jgi:hypothetical protein